MIRSLRIQNFRSHREVHLKNLSRINLLTGMNNTGKSVALEAIFLLSLSAYPQIAIHQLNRLRGYTIGSNADLPEAWESLFYQWDQSKEIILEAEEDANGITTNGKERSKPKRVVSIRPLGVMDGDEGSETDLNIATKIFDDAKGVIAGAELVQRSTQRIRGLLVRTVKPNGQVIEQKITGDPSESARTQRLSSAREKEEPVTLIPARGAASLEQEAQRYSRLQVERRQGEVLALLRIIDPRLKDLVVIAQERGSTIYGDLGAKQLMPLSLMGDGMIRALSIALSMVNSRNGVVLIDEVENGLHYSVLVQLWQLIAQMARQLNVQVFAATHSDECIRAVNEAVQTLGYTPDLQLYRFDLTPEGTRVVDYNTHELTAAIETEQEVR